MPLGFCAYTAFLTPREAAGWGGWRRGGASSPVLGDTLDGAAAQSQMGKPSQGTTHSELRGLLGSPWGAGMGQL